MFSLWAFLPQVCPKPKACACQFSTEFLRYSVCIRTRGQPTKPKSANGKTYECTSGLQLWHVKEVRMDNGMGTSDVVTPSIRRHGTRVKGSKPAILQSVMSNGENFRQVLYSTGRRLAGGQSRWGRGGRS